jgi:hypothetical protein
MDKGIRDKIDKLKVEKQSKEAITKKHTVLAKGKSMTDAQFLKYLRELHGIK